MYTPHTVTIINAWENSQGEQEYNLTILEGVFLGTTDGTNASKQGANSTDRSVLFIPFGVTAKSTTGHRKHFADMGTFYAAEDKTKLWTLNAGGSGNSTATYYVKGRVTTPMSLKALKKAYADTFDVTSVIIRDFGSKHMRHWQVTGR